MRLRYNLVGAELGAQLGDNPATDTAITFAEKLVSAAGDVPTIAAPDYLVLRVGQELMHLVAYTTGATTGTVVREREGTPAAEHEESAPVRHVPTALDFRRSALSLPTSTPSVYNHEFDGRGTSLPSGWEWLNQGSCSYAERDGAGVITVPASSNQLRGIVRALPSEDEWEAIIEFSMARASTAADSTGEFCGLLLVNDSNVPYMLRLASTTGWATTQWANLSLGSGTNHASTTTAARRGLMRVRRNSGSSWDFAVSADGVGWARLDSGRNVGSHITPTKIGFATYNNIGHVADFAIHCFRVEIL